MFTLKQVIDDVKITNGSLDGDFEPIFEKIIGNVVPGAKVKINWCNTYEGIVDKGFITYIPGHFHDNELDAVVCVPNPSNPDGKDRIEPLFISIGRLSSFPDVRDIVI